MGRTVVEDGGLDLDAYAAVTAPVVEDGGLDLDAYAAVTADARGSNFNGNEDLDKE